ncbi:PREDICTED: protein dispatched-like [Nicrophorus vespilloides]|uniref:Protein dispatched-like n=1 Tax=Nicrophorus vespilloides TaxID=110193 RepID=A0ABM1MS03_NICVS|nr:PREDICTED: protein dispatched-like [Nicrophorus vespilloides]
MFTKRFVGFTANHPYLLVAILTTVSITCLVVPATLKSLPNFSDPQMGFETRGTDLAKKLTTWKNLLESSKYSGQFVSNPKEYLQTKNYIIKAKRPSKNKTKRSFKEIPKTSSFKLTKTKKTKVPASQETDNFFCGYPDSKYAKIVIKSKRETGLFDYDSMRAMCKLEKRMITKKDYKGLCIKSVKRKCCKPWSLPNYVALMNSKKSCQEITEKDVQISKETLVTCAPFYHNFTLKPHCKKMNCTGAPKICTENDSVFNILNYMTSLSFLPKNDTSSKVLLNEAMLYLPLACSIATMPFYEDFDDFNEFDSIELIALDFGLKNALFEKILIRDAWLMIVGAIFLLISMCFYTKSPFFTFMTLIAIFLSLGISYSVYTYVYQLEFFPFMNLLAVIVTIGIGADDAFIFSKLWREYRASEDSLEEALSKTLQQAFVTMLVTSMTTSVAFFASYFSSITAIKCFGVFAGTAVLTNFILAMLWLPPTVIIQERIKGCNFNCSCGRFSCFLDALQTTLIKAIIKFKHALFIIFSTAGCLASIAVFYYPKLRLPDNNDFQLFDSSHPFEQYELIYKNKFWFTQNMKENEDSIYKLPLRFVWGVSPADNGNYMDPQNLGDLELDESFNFYTPQAQEFMYDFCKDLQSQPFCRRIGLSLGSCFMETFVDLLKRRCSDLSDSKFNKPPCCNLTEFPFESHVFNYCLYDSVDALYTTPSRFFSPGLAGPKFSKSDVPKIQAFVVEFDSTFSFSLNFDYMDGFLRDVDNWFQSKLVGAPDELKGGWFISDFDFFDLQRTLSENTLVAIIISMALALGVLFLTTLNILVSLFGVLVITCSILSTMASLVLIGWKLNILESIAISSIIGLTVDFSLHLTVNFRFAPDKMSREEATISALRNTLGPVTMAALTTSAAGYFMIFSSVLAYKQIGQFLCIVMIVSWLFAVFHLGSLLALAGPENQCGQLSFLKFLRTFISKKELTFNESHELERMNALKLDNN